eukprot:CAMPEP_0114302818 /NCGR_PEP_ID=MMETSP0059-20121206/14869_1 /TAXON_ID=36894 /ORGANISM="Pyramimonas parkeae, Strain CCMP726" /LENGTH=84 /DNA_ID=CAMNT_0001425701 /DNA_START=1046 /DNA_END=1296 /DNA_ORIENTATION=-
MYNDSVMFSAYTYKRSAGIRWQTNDTKCLLRIDNHKSAAYSDGDEGTRSPWIIRLRFELDTRVLKVTLCTDKFSPTTQLTWLPA